MSEITRLLEAAERGEREAEEKLLNLVYAELHRMAEQKFAGEAPGHTLQPTALVHDAWFQLFLRKPRPFLWRGGAGDAADSHRPRPSQARGKTRSIGSA